MKPLRTIQEVDQIVQLRMLTVHRNKNLIRETEAYDIIITLGCSNRLNVRNIERTPPRVIIHRDHALALHTSI